MGATAVAQLNVRIDRDVKAAGEGAIAAMGLSVTDFVRELWEKLAGSEEDRAAIEQAVLGTAVSRDEAREDSARCAQRLDALARMRTLRDQWMLSVGLDDSSLLGGEAIVCEDGRHPDRELALAALIERTEERDIR